MTWKSLGDSSQMFSGCYVPTGAWLDGQASLLFGWLKQLQLYTSYYLSILSVNMVTIVLLLQQSVPEISIVQAKNIAPRTEV